MQKPDTTRQNTDLTGSAAHPFRVGLVPLPGFALMSYACTVEPLRAANLLSRRELYELIHFGQTPYVASSGAAHVERTLPVGETRDLDLLLVIAGGDPFAFDAPQTLNWLTEMADRVDQIGGVSGGSVILTRLGLMSGRRMTVHWEHAAQLGEAHPDAVIERRLYVMDRDRVTCGGGTAPLDMMHALISAHHGSVFARLVSDWFLHTDIRASAAPQRSLRADDLGRAPVAVTEAVAAMENHIADPLTLVQLAMMTGVSARHLNRLFGSTVGQSAMDYYRQLRLDVGRRLITGSSMPVAAVAEATGFSTPSHFSNLYHAAYDARPSADRRSHVGPI